MLNRSRVKPILLLDEAMSSVGLERTTSLRALIHDEFTAKCHTVMSIRRRLSGMEGGLRDGENMADLCRMEGLRGWLRRKPCRMMLFE